MLLRTHIENTRKLRTPDAPDCHCRLKIIFPCLQFSQISQNSAPILDVSPILSVVIVFGHLLFLPRRGFNSFFDALRNSHGRNRNTLTSQREFHDFSYREKQANKMSDEQLYMVNWRKHSINFLSTIKDLLESNLLTDMKLIVDDDRSIFCHKIVLASCSDYFRNFMLSSPNTKSMVLYGIKYADMKALLDYMYTGEMKVPQTELENVTRLAKFLKIKGLTTDIDEVVINVENDQISSTPSSLVQSNSVINGSGDSVTAYAEKKQNVGNEETHEASSSVGNLDFEEERHR